MDKDKRPMAPPKDNDKDKAKEKTSQVYTITNKPRPHITSQQKTPPSPKPKIPDRNPVRRFREPYEGLNSARSTTGTHTEEPDMEKVGHVVGYESEQCERKIQTTITGSTPKRSLLKRFIGKESKDPMVVHGEVRLQEGEEFEETFPPFVKPRKTLVKKSGRRRSKSKSKEPMEEESEEKELDDLEEGAEGEPERQGLSKREGKQRAEEPYAGEVLPAVPARLLPPMSKYNTTRPKIRITCPGGERQTGKRPPVPARNPARQTIMMSSALAVPIVLAEPPSLPSSRASSNEEPSPLPYSQAPSDLSLPSHLTESRGSSTDMPTMAPPPRDPNAHASISSLNLPPPLSEHPAFRSSSHLGPPPSLPRRPSHERWAWGDAPSPLRTPESRPTHDALENIGKKYAHLTLDEPDSDEDDGSGVRATVMMDFGEGGHGESGKGNGSASRPRRRAPPDLGSPFVGRGLR